MVDCKLKDSDAVFSVVDQVVRVSAQHYGALITKEAYRNYPLIVEYRWGLLLIARVADRQVRRIRERLLSF